MKPPRLRPTVVCPALAPLVDPFAALADAQSPVSNSIGRVVGPLSAVSGFHGAGPVRRGLCMRCVMTVRASASSRRARCEPRQ